MIRLISFKAPLIADGTGFIIPAALSREYMQFGPKVPGIHTPIKITGRRVELMEKWGLVVVNDFRTAMTYTRFGRVIARHATANGKAAALPYAVFLSRFINGYTSTSPRERGIKQAILAKNVKFFEDCPQDIQFLFTVGLFNEYDVRAYHLVPDKDDFNLF